MISCVSVGTLLQQQGRKRQQNNNTDTTGKKRRACSLLAAWRSVQICASGFFRLREWSIFERHLPSPLAPPVSFPLCRVNPVTLCSTLPETTNLYSCLLYSANLCVLGPDCLPPAFAAHHDCPSSSLLPSLPIVSPSPTHSSKHFTTPRHTHTHTHRHRIRNPPPSPPPPPWLPKCPPRPPSLSSPPGMSALPALRTRPPSLPPFLPSSSSPPAQPAYIHATA